MGFKGGDLWQQKLRDVRRDLTSAKEVRVGFLEGAAYDDGTSIPMVAASNEFGAPSRGQPPRPFFRNMIAAKKDTWGPALGALLKEHKLNARTALTLVGAGIKGQLQQSITDLTSPPLAASTIRKKKGVTKPLIDTGVMLRSVDYEVN